MQETTVSPADIVMTPAARVQAAIEILDDILGGVPAEKSLTGWARRSRFAGSKDRAAIRDHVFSALRQRRSLGWIGGAETGRGLMIGQTVNEGLQLSDTFTGDTHAPPSLSSTEIASLGDIAKAPQTVRLDAPEWLWSRLQESLDDNVEGVLSALQERAPLHLRANLLKINREKLRVRLLCENVETNTHQLAETALEVEGPIRGLSNLASFKEGLFELQDAASQAVVERLSDYVTGARVLDYCAGGGGKTLAMAAFGPAELSAHDVNVGRMKDISVRSGRAGAIVRITEKPQGTFDLVLCDAPCSGSGAWRRQPAAKWDLNEARLKTLTDLQQRILEKASLLVRPGGHLAYATCSLLNEENSEQVDRFLSRNTNWIKSDSLRLTPLDGGDGFFLALMRKNTAIH